MCVSFGRRVTTCWAGDGASIHWNLIAKVHCIFRPARACVGRRQHKRTTNKAIKCPKLRALVVVMTGRVFCVCLCAQSVRDGFQSSCSTCSCPKSSTEPNAIRSVFDQSPPAVNVRIWDCGINYVNASIHRRRHGHSSCVCF